MLQVVQCCRCDLPDAEVAGWLSVRVACQLQVLWLTCCIGCCKRATQPSCSCDHEPTGPPCSLQGGPSCTRKRILRQLPDMHAWLQPALQPPSAHGRKHAGWTPRAGMPACSISSCSRHRWQPPPHRSGPRAQQGSTEAPASQLCPVVEHLLLLRAQEGVGADAMEAALDSLWSLQYMVPGVMCAAAAPVATWHQPGAAPGTPAPYTHLVHFRMASHQALQQFTGHPLYSRTIAEAANPLCSCVQQVAFQGMLPKDMEALFKRGDQLETGWLQVLLLGPGPTQALDAGAFLSRLAQLAEAGSAAGAQATHGPVLPGMEQAAAMHHFLMVHFAAQEDMQQFWSTPACQALAACDARLPVQLQASIAGGISPSDATNSTAF